MDKRTHGFKVCSNIAFLTNINLCPISAGNKKKIHSNLSKKVKSYEHIDLKGYI